MNLQDSLFAIIGIILVLIVVAVQQLQADEMVHDFKSPSFNGQGTSSHYLTIENQEFNRAESIRKEIEENDTTTSDVAIIDKPLLKKKKIIKRDSLED